MIGTENCLFKNKNNKDVLERENTNRVSKMWAIIAAFSATAGVVLTYILFWVSHRASDNPYVSSEFFTIGLMGLLFSVALIVFGAVLHKLFESIKNLDTLLRTNGIAQSTSPRTLTPRGKKLSGLINGKAIAKRYKDKIKTENSFPPYAIERACLTFARDRLYKLLSPDEIGFFETIAYEEGSDVQTLCLVVGFEMRDLILAERETNETQATG